MMNVLLLSFILSAPIIGAFWSFPGPHYQEVVLEDHERIVIKFDDQLHGSTKVSISKPADQSDLDGIESRGLFGKCPHKLANMLRKTKDVVSDTTHKVATDFYKLEEQAKDVIDNAVGLIGEQAKETLSEKLTESVAMVAEQAVNAAKKTVGLVSIGDDKKGTLKDYAVKMEEWDLVDSPKRIGEDIERNASRKIEQGVEEVKETVEYLKDSTPNELITQSENKIRDVFFFSLEKIRCVISWFHLFGFSIAYGMGVWVTFFSSWVLRKCLSKQQFGMVLNKINMVYFRGMAYCVGAALFGFLVSQGRKGFSSNKMAMFQGFNLGCALVMSLINMLFLEPRTTK